MKKLSLNFIKSLLGIETMFVKRTETGFLGLNFIKSLLGIETLLSLSQYPLSYEFKLYKIPFRD